MFINGTDVINGTEITQDKTDGNIVVLVDKKYKYTITPNIISESWLLHNNNRYDLIKETKGWKSNVYNYIINNKNKPCIVLIGLLLVCK